MKTLLPRTAPQPEKPGDTRQPTDHSRAAATGRPARRRHRSRFHQLHGRFPRGRAELPDDAVDYVARAVQVPASALVFYEWDGRTSKDHRTDIRTFTGFRECGVDDAEKAAEWLAGNVCKAERRPDRVRVALLNHLKEEQIEPPSKLRLLRIIGSGLEQAEKTLTLRVFKMTQAALEAPEETISEAIYPVVPGGVDTLVALWHEYRAKGSTYRQHRQRVFNAFYTNHYRTGLIQIPEALEFGSANTVPAPMMTALAPIKRYRSERTNHTKYYATGESVPLPNFDLVARFKQVNVMKLYLPGKGDRFAYPLLGPAPTRPIRPEVIENNYDLMIKYATAIRQGTASAETLLRRFTGETTHPAYSAMYEVGCAQRTITRTWPSPRHIAAGASDMASPSSS
nr:Tn3 family transposase [Streptosporangium roseum]